MSRRSSGLLCVSLFLLASACVDVGERFDEFGARVIDADTTRLDGDILDEIPDVNGQFYLSISPVIAPASLLQFISDVEMTMNEDGTATLNLSFQPLCAREGDGEENCGEDYLTPIGDVIVVNGVTVQLTGGFVAFLEGATVPGKANPISGAQITGDIRLLGFLKTEDLFCGDVDGMLAEPIPNLNLEGSTFGAVRIAEGTLGEDLPEPVFECPPDVPDVDGTPDGGGSLDSAPST